jgi:hypothetical protein
MDARTLAALDASILHWEQNAAAEKPGDASCSADDCALCDLVNLGVVAHTTCIGCPVFEKTGRKLCDGTPYAGASVAWKDWVWATSDEVSQRGEEFRAAAQREVEFLRSLRPAEESAVDP